MRRFTKRGVLGAVLLALITKAWGAETNKVEALKPEEMFEGGKETYNNWVEFSAGGFSLRGNPAQGQERHRLNRGVFGGIEDFHYSSEVATNTVLTIDGRAIFDAGDYKLRLGLTREEVGYLRFNFENFRTWSNDDGGFYPPTGRQFSRSGEALSLERGEISFEAGLTLENKPKATFKYTHRYREGEKSSTIWGPAHPEINLPAGDPGLVRALSLSFYDIDEARDIFQLDVSHPIKKTLVGAGLRYEVSEIDNARKMTQWPGEPLERRITNREGLSDTLFNIHAFSETWLRKDLFFSSGFLFANLENTSIGSRIYGDDFDVNYSPAAQNGLGYFDLNGGAHQREYVLNLNLMSMPLTNLTVTPSIRVQREDWNGTSAALQTMGATAPVVARSDAEGDALDVRERLDIRYTGLTNWVYFARGEWTQGEGNLEENGGLGTTPGILRETEDSRFFQKYTVGAKWYPIRRLTIDLGGYYKLNEYDYEHLIDSTANASANRYPAYLVMQNFETWDGNLRVTLRPWQTVTLVSRYEYQLSTINTAPDPVSGLDKIETSDMTSHIIAQNVGWVPLSRLSLQLGVNYVVSKTQTPASAITEAILDSRNNYWTANYTMGIVLDDKTDLDLTYFWYRSDNYIDNSAAGLPLGAEATEHGATATLIRRITEALRVKFRYGYFNYDDLLSGRGNNYQAHLFFSSLQYRF